MTDSGRLLNFCTNNYLGLADSPELITAAKVRLDSHSFETWYKMSALIQSRLDLLPTITHRFHIDEFQKGFDTMRSGQSGKVISQWG